MAELRHTLKPVPVRLLLALFCCVVLAEVADARVVGKQDANVSGVQRKTHVNQLKPRPRANYTICTTAECTVAAANIIEAMDPSADPCVDFYQFTCGGWIAENQIPDEESRWSQFDMLDVELRSKLRDILERPADSSDPLPVSEAKDMFAACMDTAMLESVGVTPLTDLLESYGGWPLTLDVWDDENYEWQTMSSELRREFGYMDFLQMYVYMDRKNTNRSIVYVDQASLGLSRTILINDNNTYDELLTAYRKYAADTAKVIRTALDTAVTDEQIDIDVQELVDFEGHLAAITTPDEERRNQTRMYNPMTVAELQSFTDASVVNSMDWLTYLNNVLTGSSAEPLTETDTVIVVETTFLLDLVALISNTPERVLSNYQNFRTVSRLASETNQLMRDISFEFDQVLTGALEPRARWQDCTDQVNSYLGMALAYPYIQENFDEGSKDDIELMVQNLRTSFKDLVSATTWMDSDTQTVSQEKADYIREFIAYPDWLMNVTELENYYPGVSLSNSSHFGNIHHMRSFHSRKLSDKLNVPTDRDEWVTDPTIVNAFYSPEHNSITFPAGILQPPFYGAGRTAAVNYGGIGLVIGHEITHGFDDQGRQYDKFGNLADWWSPSTVDNYQEEAQCFVDMYNNYQVPEISDIVGEEDAHVNGVITLGENIADNGGLREAFLAYQYFAQENGEQPRLPGLEEYTPEQLFFISNGNIWCEKMTDQYLAELVLTNPHSPGKFRVWGPDTNFDEFTSVWGCEPGDAMNGGDQRCVLW